MSRSLIIRTDADCPDDWKDDTFVLVEEAARIDDSTTYEVLQFLYENDINIYSVPAYRILWTHLAANYPNRGSLLELIPLAMRLDEHIRSGDIETVVVGGGISDLHSSLVEDVSREHGCTVQYQNDSLYDRARNVQRDVWNAVFQPVMLLLNQLFSLFFSNSTVGNKPLTIFPYPGRYDSTLPLAQELDEHSECLIPHLASDVFRTPDIDYNIPLKSYQDYSTLEVIRREITVWVEMLRPKHRNQFSDELTTQIQSEFDVYLPRTISGSVELVFDLNARPIMYYCWADEYFSKNEVSAAMVGGLSPRDLSILEAASKNEIDTYYVHHSVTTGDEFLPPTDTVHFAPSEIGKDHIESIYDGSEIPPLCVKGRPYFDERYNRTAITRDPTPSEQSKFTVLAATQPYEDTVRSEFVSQVHRACASSNLVDEVKIKIHPSESESYYRGIISELNNEKRISLAGTDLEEEIANSSLVISINSNVSLESMIQGTPTICYNPWHPSIQNKPYTKSPEVPIFEEPDKLNNFFDSHTRTSIYELTDRQKQFAHDQFLDNDSATKAIADEIRGRSLVNG